MGNRTDVYTWHIYTMCMYTIYTYVHTVHYVWHMYTLCGVCTQCISTQCRRMYTLYMYTMWGICTHCTLCICIYIMYTYVHTVWHMYTLYTYTMRCICTHRTPTSRLHVASHNKSPACRTTIYTHRTSTCRTSSHHTSTYRTTSRLHVAQKSWCVDVLMCNM